MADRVLPSSVSNATRNCEVVNVHTRKIFDSCRDKDCIEDLRVYPLFSAQSYIEGAFSIRPRSAELLFADVDVEEITFNRGFYTVDVRFYYRISASVLPGGCDIFGLAVFDKRVILYGSEGNAKTFTSDSFCRLPCCPGMGGSNDPIAVVEAVDPLVLGLKVVDPRQCTILENELQSIPDYVAEAFGEELVFDSALRRLYVTLGQFSIIRLERDTQLALPMFDYSVPDKECVGSAGDDDPCTLFSKIKFPIEEFFPPDETTSEEDYRTVLQRT